MAQPVVLFLAANPSDTPRLKLEEELQTIQEAISPSSLRIVPKFDPTWKSLIDSLTELKPHVVHFSGHGTATAQIQLIKDGQAHPIDGELIARLFGTVSRKTRLVVLNACYTARAADEIKKHVACTIGTTNAIPDKTAVQFAARLYHALSWGESVKDAFEAAKIELEGNNDPNRSVFVQEYGAGINSANVFLVGKPTSDKLSEYGEVKRAENFTDPGSCGVPATSGDSHGVTRVVAEPKTQFERARIKAAETRKRISEGDGVHHGEPKRSRFWWRIATVTAFLLALCGVLFAAYQLIPEPKQVNPEPEKIKELDETLEVYSAMNKDKLDEDVKSKKTRQYHTYVLIYHVDDSQPAIFYCCTLDRTTAKHFIKVTMENYGKDKLLGEVVELHVNLSKAILKDPFYAGPRKVRPITKDVKNGVFPPPAEGDGDPGKLATIPFVCIDSEKILEVTLQSVELIKFWTQDIDSHSSHVFLKDATLRENVKAAAEKLRKSRKSQDEVTGDH